MKLKQNTKIRVIQSAGDVSFYTTAKQIREGVGCFSTFNIAVAEALESLENLRTGKKKDIQPLGLLGNWAGHILQLDIVD
jgi:hypothetical protein